MFHEIFMKFYTYVFCIALIIMQVFWVCRGDNANVLRNVKDYLDILHKCYDITLIVTEIKTALCIPLL